MLEFGFILAGTFRCFIHHCHPSPFICLHLRPRGWYEEPQFLVCLEDLLSSTTSNEFTTENRPLNSQKENNLRMSFFQGLWLLVLGRFLPSFNPRDCSFWLWVCKGSGQADERTFWISQHEIFRAKGSWLFRVYVAWQTTQLRGDYNKPFIRIPMKQPSISMESIGTPVFFFCGTPLTNPRDFFQSRGLVHGFNTLWYYTLWIEQFFRHFMESHHDFAGPLGRKPGLTVKWLPEKMYKD